MREIFNNQDRALSLICRCCRSHICERRLAKSDRMAVPRWLWPYGEPHHEWKATNRWLGFLTDLLDPHRTASVKGESE